MKLYMVQTDSSTSFGSDHVIVYIAQLIGCWMNNGIAISSLQLIRNHPPSPAPPV